MAQLQYVCFRDLVPNKAYKIIAMELKEHPLKIYIKVLLRASNASLFTAVLPQSMVGHDPALAFDQLTQTIAGGLFLVYRGGMNDGKHRCDIIPDECGFVNTLYSTSSNVPEL